MIAGQIMQKFCFTLMPDPPLKLLPSFTLRPRQVMPMAIAMRE
ncbi:MAG: hypothetical protein AAGA16_15355 [Cyanobacteria bacterium P01_E01_bin.35]